MLLPYSRLLTATGLALDLADDPPGSQSPTLVLEVPAHGREVRLYGIDGPHRVVLRDDLATAWPAAEWVVLKADVALTTDYMLRLFADLEELGVHRMSLAVLSTGWFPPPKRPSRLHLGNPDGVEVYDPENDGVYYTSRWIPPPGRVPPPCEWESYRVLRRTEADCPVPAAGELPERVAIPGEDSYEQMVRSLGRAIAAHVGAIHVQLAEPED